MTTRGEVLLAPIETWQTDIGSMLFSNVTLICLSCNLRQVADEIDDADVFFSSPVCPPPFGVVIVSASRRCQV